MIKDRGVILRRVPYSDSAIILSCFTHDRGLISLFTRAQKKSTTGHLQIGSFILFTAKSKPDSDLFTLIEGQWDSNIPSQPIPSACLGVWSFTIEILYKSLATSFPIPQLLHQVSGYYAHLCLGDISTHPYVPLCLILHAIGISDLRNPIDDQAVYDSLTEFNLISSDEDSESFSPDRAFKKELVRFQQHFNVDQIESLYLVD